MHEIDRTDPKNSFDIERLSSIEAHRRLLVSPELFGNRYQLAVLPPLTRMIWPVM
jgi:hypothetical protein